VQRNEDAQGTKARYKNFSTIPVENSSCKIFYADYICTDLVPGLITGIKREVRCNSGAIPVAVKMTSTPERVLGKFSNNNHCFVHCEMGRN
jgi:hypothetical protein